MRKITIRELIPPNPEAFLTGKLHYQVFLGNRITRYFKNRKHARKFLADTNRFLNTRLHELNFIYVYTFGEYRRAWFYFDSQDPGRQKNLLLKERGILESFSAIDKAFLFAVRRLGGRNWNYLVFHKLYYVCDQLSEALAVIRSIMLDRKYYAETQRLDMFSDQLKTIREKLDNYGRIPEDADPFTWSDPAPINDAGVVVFSSPLPDLPGPG